ncbi:MAG: hypothetical protein U0903_18805 [Planctomycetales bacterium]
MERSEQVGIFRADKMPGFRYAWERDDQPYHDGTRWENLTTPRPSAPTPPTFADGAISSRTAVP